MDMPAQCLTVITVLDQQEPSFEEKMIEIYGEGNPRPATPEEYEMAHVYRAKVVKELDEKVDAARRQEDEEQSWKRFFGQKSRKKTAWNPLNPVTLDSIGGEVLMKQIEGEEKKKEEAAKEAAKSDLEIERKLELERVQRAMQQATQAYQNAQQQNAYAHLAGNFGQPLLNLWDFIK